MTPDAAHFSHRVTQGVCLLLLAGAWGLGHAQSLGAPMQLELPSLDGASFGQLSDLPTGTVLLNFWRSDCLPCVAELPLLSDWSRRHPAVRVLGIATESAASARQFLGRHAASYPQLLAPAVNDGLMRRFGNRSGALPFTVWLNEKHQICQIRIGAVDLTWLDLALVRCSV